MEYEHKKVDNSLSRGHFGILDPISEEDEERILLSDNIYLLSNRNIGGHENVYEGEITSSVYGVRPCVIKFAEISAQNIREAEILIKLGSHTNVIAMIQAGTYSDVFGDRVYIALDKCHHENLRQYLANRRDAGTEFDLDQALDFTKQIIDGVMYIHDNNVIHLDLKPSNILISQNLSLIKVADFGLSINVKSSKSKVLVKGQFGTNGYRPIESFGNGDVSMKTDIFSLGATLFHVLSNGNDVFGHEEYIFIHNVMNDVTNTVGLLVSNPVTTEHLIKCMVNKERCRRPSIREVFDHPCWIGKERACDFQYFAEENYDVDTSEEEANESGQENEKIEQTQIEKDIAFLKKMREMGCQRESTIVLFDHISRQLYRFDRRRKSFNKMHEYHECMASLDFSAITFGEYIYVFKENGTVYRIEYGDVTANWQKMNDAIGRPGYRPQVVASSNSIYLFGAFCQSKTKKSISKYNPLLDQWERLKDKPIATDSSSYLCTNTFLYCFGGFDIDVDSDKTTTKRVDKMNLNSTDWLRIADMIWNPVISSAVEHRGDIFVIGDHIAMQPMPTTIQKYDTKIDQWTEVTQINTHYLTWTSKTVVIDSVLYVVGTEGIHKYNLKDNEWSELTMYTNWMYVEQFVFVNMARY